VIDIRQGDCFEVLAELEAGSIDACVTDPPYGIGFMGREWDTFKPATLDANSHRSFQQVDRDRLAANPNLKGRKRSPVTSPSQIEYDRSAKGQHAFQSWSQAWAVEVLRVMKPGAHLVVCGAPRSYHRMTCGLEDAGFEIRDSLLWLFGQGFPKSRNLGDGRGTALKPSYEPIVLARKPCEGSTTANVEKHGTGALNIEACRVEPTGERLGGGSEKWTRHSGGWRRPWMDDPDAQAEAAERSKAGVERATEEGRWPANLVLDEEAAAMLDAQSGERVAGHHPTTRGPGGLSTSGHAGQDELEERYSDTGGASRFYYVAKPSRAERDQGCEDLPPTSAGEATGGRKEGSAGLNSPRAGAGRTGGGRNAHPTVKPVALMRWLVRLVTPPGGVVLDPFMGSGTTGMACQYERLAFIGIEREAEWMEVARRRVLSVAPLFAGSVEGDQ
jgi:site-specific DNA-methyltransferase (adenine-specific)